MNKYKNLMKFSQVADSTRRLLLKLADKAANGAYVAEKMAAEHRAQANRDALYAAADFAKAAQHRLEAQRKTFLAEVDAIRAAHPAFPEA